MGSIRIGRFDDFKGSNTLLIEADEEGLESLIEIIRQVASGQSSRLDQCPGVISYGSLRVGAETSSEDIGVVASNGREFIWRLSPASWAEAVEKLQAMQGAGPCHQYLSGPTDHLHVMVAKGEYGDAWWKSHAG
jgi:hypothetical protein